MNARSLRFSFWCCRIGAANGERMAHEVGSHVGPEGIALRPADLCENRAQDGCNVAGCEAGGDVHAKVARACADAQHVARPPCGGGDLLGVVPQHALCVGDVCAALRLCEYLP